MAGLGKLKKGSKCIRRYRKGPKAGKCAKFAVKGGRKKSGTGKTRGKTTKKTRRRRRTVKKSASRSTKLRAGCVKTCPSGYQMGVVSGRTGKKFRGGPKCQKKTKPFNVIKPKVVCPSESKSVESCRRGEVLVHYSPSTGKKLPSPKCINPKTLGYTKGHGKVKRAGVVVVR